MQNIEIDIVHEAPIFDILNEIEENKGKIIDFIARGPAGGNPCLLLQFPTKENAETYMNNIGFDDINLHLTEKTTLKH